MSAMKRLLYHASGLVALLAVTAAVAAMLYYLATNMEAASKLASSMLGGMGSAMGAFLGGALILRFKAARRFVRRIILENDDA